MNTLKVKDVRILSRTKVALEAYKKERLASWAYSLKDLTNRDLHDRYSIIYRQNIVQALQQQLDELIRLGEQNFCSREFNEAACNLVATICEKIEEIPDRRSKLRKVLVQNRDGVVRMLMNVAQDVSTRTTIQQTSFKHMNNLLADKIVEYQEQRASFLSSPIARIWDYFYPKRRDNRDAQLNGVVRQLRNCNNAESYAAFVAKSDELIGKLVKKDAPVATLLSHIRLVVSKKLTSGLLGGLSKSSEEQNYVRDEKVVNFQPSELLNGLSESSDEQNDLRDEKMAHFQRGFCEGFTGKVLAHLIAAQGLMKIEESLLGHVSMTIGAAASIAPVGRFVGTLGSQLGVYLDGKRQQGRDNAIAESIPYDLLPKVAKALAEKLALRFVAQLDSLYYSSLSQDTVQKFVDCLVSNAMKNLQHPSTISINDESKLALYRKLIQLRKEQGKFDVGQQYQFEALHADMLSDQLVNCVCTNFNYWSYPEWFVSTHLMHKDDKFALWFGKGLSVSGVLQKSGSVVMKGDGSLQFYKSVNSDTDTYGYVFTTAGAVQKLSLVEVKDVDDKTRSHYRELHRSYAVRIPTPVAQPQPELQVVAATETPALKNSDQTLQERAEAIANELKILWATLVTSKLSLSFQELEPKRTTLNAFDQELKMHKSLRTINVKVGAGEDVIPLRVYLKSVNDQLDKLQAALLTSALTASIQTVSHVTHQHCRDEARTKRGGYDTQASIIDVRTH